MVKKTLENIVEDSKVKLNTQFHNLIRTSGLYLASGICMFPTYDVNNFKNYTKKSEDAFKNVYLL